eukprot:3550657-Rhodomonas_salina.2
MGQLQPGTQPADSGSAPDLANTPANVLAPNRSPTCFSAMQRHSSQSWAESAHHQGCAPSA